MRNLKKIQRVSATFKSDFFHLNKQGPTEEFKSSDNLTGKPKSESANIRDRDDMSFGSLAETVQSGDGTFPLG